MIIKLKFVSKNIKSLDNVAKLFFRLLYHYSVSKENLFKKKKKKIFLSVLKSPHVNKSSQEQFSEKLYNIQISIYSQNYLIILLFLKIFNSFFLSDTKLKLSFFLDEHYSFLDQQKVKLVCKKNSLYVNMKDILGEQNFSFNSSEVEHRTENP